MEDRATQWDLRNDVRNSSLPADDDDDDDEEYFESNHDVRKAQNLPLRLGTLIRLSLKLAGVLRRLILLLRFVAA